ncbi:MAG: P1 family peptidase [Eubacteriales bacterium]|nr:P1 family peptidase [Eubacteriales bacterium]
MIREIGFTDIPGVRTGQAEDPEGGTGCTVLLFQNGGRAGCDIRGGGPASRETELLRPEKTVEQIHAVVLSGGSAFGLEAADGVMRYLSEKGIGFDVGIGTKRVPIVCGASIFDLGAGSSEAYPDREMGYRACLNSEKGEEPLSGNHGAGTGATVGKFSGAGRAMKSGIGFYAAECGKIKIGACACVNALGDVTEHESGRILAGLRSADGKNISGSVRKMLESLEKHPQEGRRRSENKGPVQNTTISCIVTNGKLTKTACTKLAQTAADAYARSIRPVHSSLDGDSVFFVSAGEEEVSPDVLSVLSEEILSRAIERSVKEAESAYGYPAMRDLPSALLK